jgi:hypothetical protein
MYFFVEVSYLILFLFLRGILGSYVVFKIVQSDVFDTDEKVISIIFYLVSLAFIYEILGYIAHRYKTRIVSKLHA